jgi:hypothetical protein
MFIQQEKSPAAEEEKTAEEEEKEALTEKVGMILAMQPDEEEDEYEEGDFDKEEDMPE